MQEAFTSTDDPETTPARYERGLLDFAFRSPELYQVMHGLAGIVFLAVWAS